MGLSRELIGTHCGKLTIVQYMNINRKNPAVFINSYDDKIITNNASQNLDQLQGSIMIFYPKKQKYFKTLTVSIDKAIYLNKECFCSNSCHLIFHK